MATLSVVEETLQLTLTLPKAVTQHIREQVATGVYEDEGDYVESILLSETLFEPRDEASLTHWITTEGARRLEAMRANPTSVLTLDEAFEGLIDEDE